MQSTRSFLATQHYWLNFSIPLLMRSSFMSLIFIHLRNLILTLLLENLKSMKQTLFFQIQFQKKPVYIYLLLEFQSTVDKFMALRILEYIVQFYKDLLKVEKHDRLPQVFPLLLYSGDKKWTAPTQFGDLLVTISIPNKYIPNFHYYKIAINEIPKGL
jgi:hypothetical protein